VPQECLLVGDTVLDVRCAKATGAYAAAVLSGFGEREELARAKPDLLLESAAQLREWL
jgi:phosphoglycolate phosphatase-like HAD superfamily hydrolase